MKYQSTSMTHSPISGFPYYKIAAPQAGMYRQDNPTAIWHYNPWTGKERARSDIEHDPYGHAIVPPGEPPKPTRRARDATDAIRKMLSSDPQMNVLLQEPAPQIEQIAPELIKMDQGLERWYAETLARQLLDSEIYAGEVSARVRNHARRVLGIRFQEDE